MMMRIKEAPVSCDNRSKELVPQHAPEPAFGVHKDTGLWVYSAPRILGDVSHVTPQPAMAQRPRRTAAGHGFILVHY